MRDSTTTHGAPEAQGLYDPTHERDACGLGFVAHLHGERSHDIVRHALTLLVNMSHRGATAGADATGDGAGILLQIPHAFLRAACRDQHIPLPELGEYGLAMMFLPEAPIERASARRLCADIVSAHGWRVLGWRRVRINADILSGGARATVPAIEQLFVVPTVLETEAIEDATAFERRLYVMRREIEREAQRRQLSVYASSFSSRTVVYKGLLRPDQLAAFYDDLREPDVASGLALVHSRFSTNTFPSWSGAHPFRFVCHNGEINTLRGNVNWMTAREPDLASVRFPHGARELTPIVRPDQSDSASLDNALELLVHAGRPLSHAMAMLVPEAWQNDATMSADRRAFYAYHASLMEPWDGPAALAFTDGRQIGAVQDRNGLRPARWFVTDDDLVILASEAGVLPIDANRIRERGRLQPGKMLLVNTSQGRLLHDDEVKSELASLRPYRKWVGDNRIALDPLVQSSTIAHRTASATDLNARVTVERSLLQDHRLFGYTREELSIVLAPMGETGEEAVSSMGNDAPLAVFSERPQLLYSYFRQLFAQVTNPPIDPIREHLVMSLKMWLGAQRNLLEETPEHARQIEVDHPVLRSDAIGVLRAIAEPTLRAITLPTLFDASDAARMQDALTALCDAAAHAAMAGYGVLILSDKDADSEHAPIPSLLATAAVHQHLVRIGVRARVSLVIESGDAREVSHIALLFSHGASAVYPYLAIETVRSLANDRRGDADKAARLFIKALEKGLLKILSKLGISTLQSYCGGRHWEAVGLGPDVVDTHFAGVSSRLGGLSLDMLAGEVVQRHISAFSDDRHSLLDDGGEYHFRARGEAHAWNPRSIATLQRATRENSWSSYSEFSRIVDDEQRTPTTLRGMLDLANGSPISIDDVEAASSIVTRFVTGAMSFGSISGEAHESLALAMNTLGGRSNTGEGGEDPARYGTTRNSAIKQIASARFGVTAAYLASATELQIKIAQGAKPGEGGQLPGHKVDAVIARTRHSTAGVTLISPPPHHDIYSIEDLKQLIFDLRQVNPTAAISVKLVAEAGVGPVAAGVAKAGADLITISGDGGGTGAAPLSSIKRAGVPWELGLAETQQTLLLNGLRGGVRLQADGQLRTGRDVVIAALLGADEFGFATAPLVVQGCVMMRKCHLNTCPVGIATQDPLLREKFAGKPEHLINYFYFVAEEVRGLMAQLGVRSMAELVGRTDLLRARTDVGHVKARTLDLAPLLHAANIARDGAISARVRVPRDPISALNRELVAVALPALDRGESVRASFTIRNIDRAVGSAVAGDIARRSGDVGLAPDTITYSFAGSAGQSFGAFAPRGLTLVLDGEANDYVGKGLCGGRIVASRPRTERLVADGTVIVGNTVLYGATSGEAFIAGAAGERFAVRNSGATAVVEGVGDHGCEYMTGGSVIVLGTVGRNFGAGMSGGVVYLLQNEQRTIALHDAARFEALPLADTGDVSIVHTLLDQHARLTGSRRARHALAHWTETLASFVRLVPLEYKVATARQHDVDANDATPVVRYG